MANFTTDGKLCIERELAITQPEVKHEDIVQKFDVNETCKWITDHGHSTVCLQFPDELLNASAAIYEEIKKRLDIDLYILGDTSYASCCIDSVAASHVQAEAVIHYGHSCFSKSNIPVFKVLPKRDMDVRKTITAITGHFPKDNNVKLCLFYDAEFEHCKDLLSESWFQEYLHCSMAFIHMDEHTDRVFGRVIRNANGDITPVNSLRDYICVYVGSKGQTLFNFTVSLEAKDWYSLDPDTGKLDHHEETIWIKRRRFLVEKCRDANVVGILVCKLAGDQTKDIISRMKQLCKINGKKSYIVSVGKPNVAKLANFPEIDIYVMIACPENELYSNRDFYKPIVYPYELEVALNSNREPYFTNHVTDYDDLLPGKRHHCELDNIKQETDVSLITGRIRETNIHKIQGQSKDLVEQKNWALESIGQNLQERSWKGLEQKLGETEVKMTETGRKGIALQYKNELE